MQGPSHNVKSFVRGPSQACVRLAAVARKTSPKRLGSPDLREAALDLVRAWRREGGKLRWKGLSPERRREIARKAARARWGKKS